MIMRLAAERLQQALDEMKQITRMDFFLFGGTGKKLASTVKEEHPELTSAVADFIKSVADSQVVYGWHFFKVCVEEKIPYILLCNEDVDASYVLGQMAVHQIRTMCLSDQEPYDKEQLLRDLLEGKLEEKRAEERARQMHVDASDRVVYVLETVQERDAVFMETLRNFFLTGPQDYLVEMDDRRVALLKDASGMEEEEAYELADMLVALIQSEVMVRIRVACSGIEEGFLSMHKAYEEACTALKIGEIFFADEDVVRYDRLGVGRLIYQLPPELCEMFLEEVFGRNIQIMFDEETLSTINKLFENNLNISETARQLYIHRNTLVYRLERIEKVIGLDIRSFDDAMMFKIAMMVQAYLKHMNVENHGR